MNVTPPTSAGTRRQPSGSLAQLPRHLTGGEDVELTVGPDDGGRRVERHGHGKVRGGPDSRACATGNGGAGRRARSSRSPRPYPACRSQAHPGRPWIPVGSFDRRQHHDRAHGLVQHRPRRPSPVGCLRVVGRVASGPGSRDRAASAGARGAGPLVQACTLATVPGRTSTARSSSSVDVAPSSTPTVTGRSSSGRGDHRGTQAIGGSAHVVNSTSSGSVRARKRCNRSPRRTTTSRASGARVGTTRTGVPVTRFQLGRDALHPGENPREDLPVARRPPARDSRGARPRRRELRGGADLVVERPGTTGAVGSRQPPSTLGPGLRYPGCGPGLLRRAELLRDRLAAREHATRS